MNLKGSSFIAKDTTGLTVIGNIKDGDFWKAVKQ